MAEQEGVIKFELTHEAIELLSLDISSLSAWRLILNQLGLVGQDPDRYGGLGFGNLSQRTSHGFLISGSQTGAIDDPGPEHYAEVVDWDVGSNLVQSRGQVEPSSESLTHAVIYDLNPAVSFVFHVHSPDIWQMADRLGLPGTPPDVAYGTVAMAEAVRDLFPGDAAEGLLVMRGHEDGVVSFGPSAKAAGEPLVEAQAQARSLSKTVNPSR